MQGPLEPRLRRGVKVDAALSSDISQPRGRAKEATGGLRSVGRHRPASKRGPHRGRLGSLSNLSGASVRLRLTLEQPISEGAWLLT
jgi:hypothetical protein